LRTFLIIQKISSAHPHNTIDKDKTQVLYSQQSVGSILGYPVQGASSNDGTAPLIGILGSILFPLSAFF
jgi:hypothetical protein